MQSLKYLTTILALLLFLSLLPAPANQPSRHSVQLCEEISSGLKTDCMAILTEDIQLCRQLPSPDAANCINTIITKEAASKKDPDLCKNPYISPDSCYWALAISIPDSTPCNHIEDERNRLSCLAFTTRDKSHCSINYPDSCIYYSEVSKGNVSHCETISGAKRASCFSDIAILNEDTGLCEEIISDEHLSSEIRKAYSDRCLYRIALDSGRIETCSRISSADKKLLCRALISADPQNCELFENGYKRDSCYFQLALKTANITYMPASPIS